MEGMTRLWVALAAVNGLLGVALGAYGAHGLTVSPARAETFHTAVAYQMWHALALLAAAWLRGVTARRALADVAAILFLAGIVAFCGSLYAIGLTGQAPVPMAAPAGGLAFMTGWVALGAAGLLRPATR